MDSKAIQEIINPYHIKNLYYFCDECADENLPKSEAGKKKNKKQRQLQELQNTSSSIDDGENKRTSDVLKNPPVKVQFNLNLDKDDTYNEQNNLYDPKNSDETYNNKEEAFNNMINKFDEPKIGKENMESRICKHYIKGSCKHGIKGKDCRFEHPKACRKLMNHGTRAKLGCQEGKKCSSFHPKMCFESLRKGECFNNSCNFAHVKGTKRQRKQKVQSENQNKLRKENGIFF